MDRSLNELLALIRLTEKVSAELHGLATESEIFLAVIGAFRRSKRFKAHLIVEDQDTSTLRFAGTSFPPAAVRLGELVAGVSIDTFRIDPGRSPLLHRVWQEGQTVQAFTTAALADFLPSSVVPKILRRLGYEGTRDVLTPLRRGARIVGILSVTAPDLADHFVPSLQNLAHHIGAALDFADAQQARARTERQYQNLVENLNEVFFTVDDEGRFTYVSPNVTQMGFGPEQLIGQPFTDVFASAEREAIETRFRRYLRGELTTGQADYRIQADDEALRWIRISSHSIVEDGRVIGIHGSIADVTDAKAAEQALRESERILAATGHMATIGGWEHDLVTGKALWTEELYRIVEIAPGVEPPGVREHLSYYPPEDRRRLEEAYKQAVEHGTPFDLELQGRTATGKPFWCRAYGEPVHEDGRCVKMRGTFQDITTQKRAEMAHQESERRLATLMSNLPGMAYRGTNEPDWPMTFVSEGARELTGYAPEGLIESRAVSFGDLIHPDDKARLWDEVQRSVRDRRPYELTYRITSADGKLKWVWEQGRGVFSDEGELLALEGIISDITEQRRTAEELRLNEERLALALEATSDGLWDWHIPSGKTYLSPRYYAMLGYEPGEFPADFETWKSLLHPNDRQGVLRRLEDHIAHYDQGYEIEFRLRAKDSSWRWILSRGRVIERDADGRPVRMIGTHVDITSRKEDATALERALAGTIRAVARTAEVRDPYTAGHQERVALLACAIAGEMGCPATTIAALRAAGLLHDVGKIAVPSEILSKPGRLTEIEMNLVREHVDAGYRILAEIEFPWPVARMVRQHHERLDGSGYPHGLVGDAICLEARILAVADVVESMSSHRPYRAAFGIEAALEELERGRGTAFAPDVIDACARLFRDRGLTFETLPTDGSPSTD